MRTIELRDGFPKLEEVLKQASEDSLLLKLPTGQEYLLAEVDDFDKEIELTRQNDELMKLLNERSKEVATFTHDQVMEQLDLE